MKPLPEDWPRAMRLLDEALALSPAQRVGWLAQTIAHEPGVAKLLQKLLAAHGRVQTHELLATLPKLQRTPNMSDTGTAGLQIGPFELIEPLGRGGMGSVWRARYADGRLKRDVAIKLPAGSDDPAALANLRERFARERDFLAQLQHPNIARLYDAGVSDSGQPFLAMEYVAGQPIDTYCDQARLTVAARLKLFLQVLDAVAHAHQQLVLHRDLKPGNVLVDAQQQVRLLDFGVARLLPPPDAPEITRTELTERAGAAFTLGYAAPEQVNHGTLSTATDVYALGVMLYRLLTGSSPYQPTRETRGALEDAVLLATPDAASSRAFEADVLQARQTTATALRKTLRNDLDVILAKALKKNPAERYPTVTALADELRRHLAQQPISARADSWGYRASLFVARNRMAVVASALATLALIGTAGVATWQAQVSAKNAERANRAAANANAVQKVLAGMLSKADPEQNKLITAADRQLIDQTLINAEKDFAGAPDIFVLVLKQLGDIYSRLGMPNKVLEVQKKRVALLVALPGAAPEELVDAQLALGEVLINSEVASERAQTLAVLQSARETAVRTQMAPELIVRAHCLVADQLALEAQYDEADREATQAVAYAEKTLPSGHPKLADAYEYKAGTAARVADFDGARDANRKARAMDAAGPGRGQVDRLISRASLARIEFLAGNYLLAKNESLAALDEAKLSLGTTEGTLTPFRIRAVIASVRAGQLDDAARLSLQLLPQDMTSGDSYRAGRAHFAHGLVQTSRGEHAAAAQSFTAAEPGLASNPWWKRNLQLAQATLPLRQNDAQTANGLLGTMVAQLRVAGDTNSEEFAFAAQRAAVSLARQTKWQEARGLMNEACAWSTAKLMADHPSRVRCDAYRMLLADNLGPADRKRALLSHIHTLTDGRSGPQALTVSLRAALLWAGAEANDTAQGKSFPLLD